MQNLEKFFIEYKVVFPLEKEGGITFHECSRRVLRLKIEKFKQIALCMLKLT